MLRIYETGDNHIGKKYDGHERGGDFAEARITALEKMVQKANEEECELFAVTGDLFENRSVASGTVSRVAGILGGFSGTVLVLPGNHDYYAPDSELWGSFRAAKSGNTVLLNEKRPYVHDCADGFRAAIYPAACFSLHSEEGVNNLDAIRSCGFNDDAHYRIGMAHGAVEGETIDSEGKYFLMTRRELKEMPMDLWLIGHTHVPFPKLIEKYEKTDETIFNAGTHVQTDVNCHTPGLGFLLELAEDGTVRAKRMISGELSFVRKIVEVVPGELEERVRTALADIPDRSFVDLIMKGTLLKEEYESRAERVGRYTARFLEYRLTDTDTVRRLTEEDIDAAYPESSICSALLKELLSEPVEAQMVHELLNGLKGVRMER